MKDLLMKQNKFKFQPRFRQVAPILKEKVKNTEMTKLI